MGASGARTGGARLPITESPAVRRLLIGSVLFLLGLFLFLPLCAILVEAFKHGLRAYFAALADRDSLAAIKLTLLTAAIAVPLNVIFGVAAAWAITKFTFPGKALLTTLLDIPFAVSPVVAGLMFILLFGMRSPLGGFLESTLGLKIVFAVPGVVIATIFVTFPFVVRELIPLMQAQGDDEEQCAVALGANGWQTFRRVTLPNIKWGLLYGVTLCNARALGEFGAVSVLSGHIRGQTVTVPLQLQILVSDYQGAAAFALASLLTLSALLTLFVKSFARRHEEKARQIHAGSSGGESEEHYVRLRGADVPASAARP
ncbi:MAG: sulfate ABC transporter permease subunit CysW [Desulfovibrio sp.]|jgi:sulfate transport system permease protein|nr:sulfate ABC transporter permease subunit CysW [Desulfovibrio sp.]